MVGDTIEGTRAGGHRSRRGYAARLATLIAVGSLVAGAVTGCTTSAGGVGATPTATGGTATTTATISPTVTPTASASTAPTAAYPADVPAEARANTPAGAIAFAKYFFGQINKAYTTPQAGLLAPLSDGGCLSCASFTSNADAYAKSGQRYSVEPLQVIDAELAKDSPPASPMVDVILKQRAAKLIDSLGSVVDTFSEKQGSFLVQLQRRSDGWVVSKIQARQ